MTRPPLNHALLAVVIGLTFLVFLGTLCNTIHTNYFTTPTYPTFETTFPSFQLRMTPALLVGYQQPPPAPNIAPLINLQPCPSLVSSKKSMQILFAVTTFPLFQPRTTPTLLFCCQQPPLAPNIASRINLQLCPSLVSLKKLMPILFAVTIPKKGFRAALHQYLQDKELPHIYRRCGSLQTKLSPEIDPDSTWMILMSSNMMTTRSRLGNYGLMQIEELRLLNKKKITRLENGRRKQTNARRMKRKRRSA
jgi:hypothetical protein